MKKVIVPRRPAFDTAGYISYDKAVSFRDIGYSTVIRYLRRDIHVNDDPDLSSWKVSLSRNELSDLLKAGLRVSLVQFSDRTMVPTVELGEKIGKAASENAVLLNAPEGIMLWCDVEWDDVPKGVTNKGTIEFINAWAYQVRKKNFEAGLYIGTNIPLTPDELYYELDVITAYWKSASYVPSVSVCGPSMIQGLEAKYNGLNYDPDMPCIDGKGRRFYVIGS